MRIPLFRVNLQQKFKLESTLQSRKGSVADRRVFDALAIIHEAIKEEQELLQILVPGIKVLDQVSYVGLLSDSVAGDLEHIIQSVYIELEEISFVARIIFTLGHYKEVLESMLPQSSELTKIIQMYF